MEVNSTVFGYGGLNKSGSVPIENIIFPFACSNLLFTIPVNKDDVDAHGAFIKYPSFPESPFKA